MAPKLSCGPRPMQPAAYLIPLQKSAGLSSFPRYSQRTKWCVPAVAFNSSDCTSIALRLGVTRYSQPSRSLAGGMTKWVMRIWKPRLGLWRCRRFASAVVPSAKQASVTIQIVRILKTVLGPRARGQHNGRGVMVEERSGLHARRGGSNRGASRRQSSDSNPVTTGQKSLARGSQADYGPSGRGASPHPSGTVRTGDGLRPFIWEMSVQCARALDRRLPRFRWEPTDRVGLGIVRSE